MNNTLDIVIAGVGGQGTLLASRVLGALAGLADKDVKVSEVHGMSQRGGSVVTYVRMGPRVHSPLIEQKGADYILAFEELEALRHLPLLKDGGTAIINTQKIAPMPVMIGVAEYPQNIIKTIAQSHNIIALDALALATQAGNARAVNTVLLGVLAANLEYPKQLWLSALTACIPERFTKANLAAFESGFSR